MTHKNVYQRLGYRMSEEVQLLAEQKWIIDSLTKIKNQRNCLQIERLHLESLKAKLKGNTRKDVRVTITKDNEESTATTSAVYLMQHAKGKSEIEKDEKKFSVNEAFCNEEELNLMVTDPILITNPSAPDFNMEEDEDESDDDMFIDMNMLMNGGLSKSRKNYDKNK